MAAESQREPQPAARIPLICWEAGTSFEDQKNTAQHRGTAPACLLLLLYLCLSFPLSACSMTIPSWDTPEFQLVISDETGCTIDAAFEDPSDPLAIIAWCADATLTSYTVSRIRFEQGSLQNISMTPIWSSPSNSLMPTVVNTEGVIRSASTTSIIRLTPNPTNSSALYDELIVWNATASSPFASDLALDLATSDVYFVTGQVYKLRQGLPPAILIQWLVTDSIHFHQSTRELFAPSANGTFVVYSPATDQMRIFANVTNLTSIGEITSFLPSPDASIVWITLDPNTSGLTEPLLVALHEHGDQVDILVTVSDCLNARYSSSLKYDSVSGVLFFNCGASTMRVQLDSNGLMQNSRILTDWRCASNFAPIQLRWKNLTLPLMFFCHRSLIASSGVSLSSPISLLDCSQPSLLSGFPNTKGQTVLLLACSGAPAVFIEGVTFPLTQLFMNINGIAHLPNTDLIYCSCTYDSDDRDTRLVEYNMRTQTLRTLATCAPLLAAGDQAVSQPTVNHLAVTNISVSYSCIDSLWRLDLPVGGTAASTSSSPIMLLNLTQIDPLLNQTYIMILSKVLSINATTIVQAYQSYDFSNPVLRILSPLGDSRRLDDACLVSDFDVSFDQASILFSCVDTTRGLSQLRKFDLLTNQTTVLYQARQYLRYSSDPRPQGTSLIVAWSNATDFVVIDVRDGRQIAWHAFPSDCVGIIITSVAAVLFSEDEVILNCDSREASSSLLTAPISLLIDPGASQPFSSLLTHSRSICSGELFSQTWSSVIDDTLLYLQCPGGVLSLTRDFRCAPGQMWIYGTCTPCAPATFKPEARFNRSVSMMDKCASCPPGRATVIAGSFACSECELGSTPDVNSLTCQVCPLGSYTPAVGSSCALCNGTNQVGLNCANGLAIVQEGYFAYPVESDDSAPIYETAICLRGLCPGGPLQLATKNGDTIDGTIQYCAEPRLNSPSNLLCGACDSTLGYVEWGTSCVRCSGVDAGMVFALIAFAIVVVAWLLVSSASRRSTTSGHVALLLYFVQTALIQLDPFPEWIQFMHVVNFSTSSVGRCIAPISPVQQTILSLSTPAILLAILACFALVQFTCQYCTVGSDHGKRVDSAALKRFSSPLVTNDAGNDANSYEMDDSNADEVVQDSPPFVTISSSSSFATRWGPLYRGYSSSSARYWTAIVLLRRSVLAVISIYLAKPEQFAYRQVAFVLIHFISYQLHIRAQPYATPALNTADGISYSLLLILGCLQVTVGGNSQPSVWMQVTVVSMVMIPTLLMIVWIGMVQWSGRRRSNSRPFDPSGSIDDVTNDNSAVSSSSNFLSRWWNQFRISFELNRYVAGAVSVLLFCYTGVIQTAFAFLRCVPVGSASLVFSAPTIDCHSQAYQHASVGVIFVLIVMGFGFPIASLVLLTLNRARIEASTVRDSNASSVRL